MARCAVLLAFCRDILALDEASNKKADRCQSKTPMRCVMTDVATRGVSREALTQSMIDLVGGMAKALVDLPEEVSVKSAPDNDGTVLLLRVAPADLGKVIGKQGRTARSIRTILGAASLKAQHRFSLDIQRVEEPPA